MPAEISDDVLKRQHISEQIRAKHTAPKLRKSNVDYDDLDLENVKYVKTMIFNDSVYLAPNNWEALNQLQSPFTRTLSGVGFDDSKINTSLDLSDEVITVLGTE